MRPKRPPFTDAQATILEQLDTKLTIRSNTVETLLWACLLLLRKHGIIDDVKALRGASDKARAMLAHVDAEMLLEAALGIEGEED